MTRAKAHGHDVLQASLHPNHDSQLSEGISQTESLSPINGMRMDSLFALPVARNEAAIVVDLDSLAWHV